MVSQGLAEMGDGASHLAEDGLDGVFEEGGGGGGAHGVLFG